MVDQLLNPTLIIAIGDFGGRVTDALLAQAKGLADRYGPEAVRNFCTLRIMTRAELVEAEARGLVDGLRELTGETLETYGASEFTRHRAMWFDPDDVDPSMVEAERADAKLFGDLLRDAYPGLRPNDQSVRKAPEDLLGDALLALIKTLFSVDQFVDFHAGHDRSGSRLDVYVVGRFDCETINHLGGDAHHERQLARFLEEHVHAAVGQSLETLIHGPLSTLFRPHHSNLSCTHVVALPVVDAGGDEGFKDAVKRARRTCARFIVRRQEALDTHGWTVPARFVLAEDRSERYLLSEAQVIDALQQFIYLLTFRRNGAPLLLRDVVHPLPDVDRLRSPVEYASRICGAFSIAMTEFPVVEMMRYLRDRQCLGVYSALTDGAPDEKYSKDMEAAAPFESPEPVTDDLMAKVAIRYGTLDGAKRSLAAVNYREGSGGGSRPSAGATQSSRAAQTTKRPSSARPGLEIVDDRSWEAPEKRHAYVTHGATPVGGPSASPGLDQNISGALERYFADARAELEEVVMSKVLAPQGYGLDPSHWSELTPMPPWGHHDEVAVPYHQELDEAQVGRAARRWPNPFVDAATPDAPAITDGWIEQKIALFHDAAHDLVENEAEARFRTLEQRLDLLSAQLLDEQKREVDVMVDGSPAGWRQANAMLNQAQEHIDRHIHTVQDELEAIEFSDLEVDHLKPLRDKARKKMQSLFDSLDKKPIYQRAAWLAVKLGLVWGVAFGALATILLPWSVGNLAITMVPAVALGVFFAWRQIKSDNRLRLDDVNAFLGRDTEDEEPGHFFTLFDQARREVFRTAYPQGQRGDQKYWLACRVEWSCLLWQLRFWKRLRRTLRVDIERLTEVGQAIEHGERRTRGDQMDLKVRFHESKNRWFEDSSRLFGDSSQFRHLLTDPQVAESFYADYAVDPHRAAEHFINETQPLDGWRDGPPMTERRQLKDFITEYFKPVEDIDFFQDQRSRPRAIKQLKTFMHEYAYKLDLLTDEGMNYDARVASGDTVLVTHPRNIEVLREVSPAEHWPGPWDILEHPVDPNFVAILHHRQGLAPWELPILGGTIDQLEALTYLGARPVVLKLIKSIPNPSKRCLAAAFVLKELVRTNRPEFEPIVPQADQDGAGLSWRLGEEERTFGSDVISAAFSRMTGDFASTDTEHICPAEDAPQWMRHFVENHQLVDLAVQLYGYQPNESSLVTSSPTRVRLEAIMSACGDMHSLSGKRSACRALLKLPKKHRDSELFGLLYADMVWDKIQQIPYGVPGVSPDEVERDYERVLRDIGVVRPWSLRSATILKNSLRLVERDQIEQAKQMIYLDRIPDSERAPLHGFDFPSVERLELFVEALAPEFERENAEHLVTNILNCFGDQTDGDVHRIDELRTILERAHPRRRTGLRKLVARYETGSLPHRLVDALLGGSI